MDIAVFSTKAYDRRYLDAANVAHNFTLHYLEPHLSPETAVLAHGFPVVCAFVNDLLNAQVLQELRAGGTRLIALRCAGFNNVDVTQAKALGMQVARVPAYSPHSIAEHTVGLMLALNRKIHRAHNRVQEGNFSLEGLLGFDMYGLTAGVIGTGAIGLNVARILHGFGCCVLAYDPYPNPACEAVGATYVPLAQLLADSDIVTLHCPLTPETHHLIDAEAIAQMKPGVMLINTSRGAVIQTRDVIEGLKTGQIGYLGLDVYEEESDIFFEDLSDTIIQDDQFARLLTFPNVLITGHQAFFTRNALQNIAEVTLGNIADFAAGRELVNSVG